MEIQKDFKELLELFNAHKVEYLIVGGYAAGFIARRAIRAILIFLSAQRRQMPNAFFPLLRSLVLVG